MREVCPCCGAKMLDNLPELPPLKSDWSNTTSPRIVSRDAIGGYAPMDSELPEVPGL